jgi:hypothetical protein
MGVMMLVMARPTAPHQKKLLNFEPLQLPFKPPQWI